MDKKEKTLLDNKIFFVLAMAINISCFVVGIGNIVIGSTFNIVVGIICTLVGGLNLFGLITYDGKK